MTKIKDLTKEEIYDHIEILISNMADYAQLIRERCPLPEGMSTAELRANYTLAGRCTEQIDLCRNSLIEHMKHCNPDELREFLTKRIEEHKGNDFQVKATESALSNMGSIRRFKADKADRKVKA